MNNITSFAVSFCIVVSVIGGLFIIFPEGKLSKSVKYIAVLSVILAFFGIFCVGFKLNVSPDLDFETESQSDTNIEFARLIFEKALENSNIKYKKIEIITDNSSGKNISIKKIKVYSDADRGEIEKAIGNTAEYEVEIINE